MFNRAFKTNLFVCILLTLFTPLSFAYETVVPRYALVIGNTNYKFSPLKNPANDARDMASTLRSLRYQVTTGYDQNPSQLRKLVADFYKTIKEKDAISLFYYAGHAIQSDNINYLMPVNASISSYERLKSQALSTNELLSSLRQSSSKQNIIILDACRNNPFKVTKKNSRGMSISDNKLLNLPRGLAPVEAPTGTLIAYSTEPGNTASDGNGRNGTYTASLLRHISKSETAEALFKKVRRDVLAATQNQQTPWEHSSLVETFYFIPPSNEEIPDIISF
ncbi:MAG: caspase family protein [Gammaproteobacteria bacterium]|nr:caspase family protein [Gammaproteobacteria bacterium]